MESASCPHCFKNFSNNASRNRHIKAIHPAQAEIKEKNSLIRCPLCTVENKQSIATHAILIQHLGDKHDIKIQEEKLIFENNLDFENWRKLEERHLDYVKTRVHRGDKIKIHYSCNRSNTFGFKSNCTKYMIKKGGSIKIDGTCPSRIIADFFNEGKVEVKFIQTHVGHTQDLRSRRLTNKEQEEIGDKLKAGVTWDRILTDAQRCKDGKMERINLLRRDDLKYQSKKNGIIKTRDPIDTMAVCIKVQEWNSENKNYAFLYKKIGYMNNVMKQKLKQFSRIICMDGTHNTNIKNYDLTIMMVKDNENMGFPVAFFLSNRQDHVIQEVCLKALKDRIGEEITPEYFMSDGDSKYHEAWKAIMGNSPRRLLCTWHVVRNWDLQGKKKIKDQTIKNEMKGDLKKIMSATKEESFIALKDAYIKKLEDKDEIEFLNYLQKMYFKDEIEKKWAYCYRLHAGINTNMALESFNSHLKGLLYRNRKTTIEQLLDTFDKAVETKMWKAIGNMERPNSNSYQDRQIAKAHKKAEQRNLDDVRMVDFGKFQVKSSTSIEHFYSVVYGNIDIVCDCASLLCRVCNICKHKYICECVEYAVKSVMCKHVHMVSLYERRVLAESKSVLGAVENETGDLYIEEKNEERLKLNETVNEFLNEKCQNFNNEGNSEENIDGETYKDIFHNDMMIKLNKIKDLDITAYKSLATQLTSVMKQFEVDTPKKRKMEKQTYYPQPQKKQRNT